MPQIGNFFFFFFASHLLSLGRLTSVQLGDAIERLTGAQLCTQASSLT